MENNESKFGFVSFAETWNGRLAMLGFVIGVATELLTGQGHPVSNRPDVGHRRPLASPTTE